MNTEPDLTKYKSTYTRVSDGRKFLGREVVPGTFRIFDTVDKVFAEVPGSTITRKFKKDKNNIGFKASGKIQGHKVRDLRRQGIKIVGSCYNGDDEW